MAIPKGYAGNVAIINLTDNEIRVITTDKFFKEYDIDPRLWIGGDGFITKILWKDIPEAIDPLSPDNEVIVATGPWTATAAPQAGRAMLGCISPETGGFSSGSFGWYFPAVMKYAGYDVIIVKGKAEKPVYISIDNEEILIRDAAHIWGKETGETIKAIREEIGERFESETRVLSISVAGENLVRYAVACGDATSCPGRSGGGTVMGSKNLKAIAVRGTGDIELYDPKGLLESSFSSVNKFLEEEPTLSLWKEHGGTTDMSVTARWPMTGDGLAENRAAADFPHYNNAGCLNCFAPCYHWLQIKDGKYAGTRQLGGHMTFITVSLRNLGIQDVNAWIYFERLIQELGLDPASYTMAFSYAVDLFVNGILTIEDTDGLELKRGDEELVWEVTRRTATREGKLGNLLADGVAVMAEKLGPEAEAIMPQTVKGKPSIQRDAKLQALIWSFGALTSPRGGDWLRLHNVWELAFLPERRDTYPEYIGITNLELYERCLELLDMPDDLKKRIFGDPPKVDTDWVKGLSGKALFVKWTEEFVSLFNNLVTCMFGGATQFMMVGFGPSTYADILNKITGWDVSYEELMAVGERSLNLMRLYNYKIKGWDVKDDRFAGKLAYEEGEVGIYKGKIVPWDEILQEYYKLRGWTPRGLPTKEKLIELKMDSVLPNVELPAE
jgi:aldehyde:ferredoxin oxidoreductase